VAGSNVKLPLNVAQSANPRSVASCHSDDVPGAPSAHKCYQLPGVRLKLPWSKDGDLIIPAFLGYLYLPSHHRPQPPLKVPLIRYPRLVGFPFSFYFHFRAGISSPSPSKLLACQLQQPPSICTPHRLTCSLTTSVTGTNAQHDGAPGKGGHLLVGRPARSVVHLLPMGRWTGKSRLADIVTFSPD
jgi:hypothetical protein